MNGHGPTWRVVAVAAALIVMALTGANYSALTERVKDTEAKADTLSATTAAHEVILRDTARRLERIESKLDRALEPRGVVQLSRPRDR